jgi:hypothetical protein
MEKQTLSISCKCSEVTLDAFIDCLLNGNLRRLISLPAPKGEGRQVEDVSDEELQAAWEKLYGEYAALSGDKSHFHLFSLAKSVTLLQARLNVVQGVLKSRADIDLLKGIGYGGDVQKIIARAKADSVELQSKQKELEGLRSAGKEGAKDADFTAWIVRVSKYMGYRIDRKLTLVSEFLTANKLMIEEGKAVGSGQ